MPEHTNPTEIQITRMMLESQLSCAEKEIAGILDMFKFELIRIEQGRRVEASAFSDLSRQLANAVAKRDVVQGKVEILDQLGLV